MKSFSLTKTIRPCYITKDVLRQLEEYLNQQVPKTLAIDGSQLQKNYSLSIVDDLGTEVFSTISEFTFPRFVDTTNEIQVEFAIRHPIFLQLSIRLGDSKDSRISLKCSSESPREAASAIYDSIKRIIESNKSANVYVFPPPIAGGLIFLFGMLLFATGTTLINKKFETTGYLILFVVLCIVLFFFFGVMFRRYIEFETNLNTRHSNLFDWFIKGFIAWIVFGTALVLLRKKFFGF